jgi:hypothetical protein
MSSGSFVTTAWRVLKVAEGGDWLQVWRVAANVSNEQLRTADRCCPPDLGLGVGLEAPHPKM